MENWRWCCVMKKRKAIQSCYFGLYKKPSFFFVRDQFDDNNDAMMLLHLLQRKTLLRISWPILSIFQNVASILQQKNSLIYHLTQEDFFFLCNHKFSISQLWLVDFAQHKEQKKIIRERSEPILLLLYSSKNWKFPKNG